MQQLQSAWDAWLSWVDVRKPLTRTTFEREFVPLAACYILMSLLVILPGTRYLRMALCPVTLYGLINAGVHWDISGGDPRSKFANQNIVVFAFILAMRVIIWTFQKVPYKRIGHPNSSPLQTFYNCMDLAWNLRGIGWDWAARFKFPPEKRPLEPSRRNAFLFQTLVSAILCIYLADFLQLAAESFDPVNFGSPQGGTIFDGSLPLPLRLLRAWAITAVTSMMIYVSTMATYDIGVIFCILILCQKPEQWPPIFDAPWLATSLADLWGKKWHSLFRQTFVEIGAKPLAYLTGSRLAGGVLGAFSVSGLLHYIALWGLGQGFDLRVPLFFIMMGVGTIVEGFWRASGRRTGGFVGWVWTIGWCIVWGAPMMDAWVTRGIVAETFMPEEIRIAKRIVTALTGSKASA